MIAVLLLVPEAIRKLGQDAAEGLSILERAQRLAKGRGRGIEILAPVGHVAMGLDGEHHLAARISGHCLERLRARHLVVGVIDLQSIEALGVKGEHLLVAEPLWVEGPLPVRILESRRPNLDALLSQALPSLHPDVPALIEGLGDFEEEPGGLQDELSPPQIRRALGVAEGKLILGPGARHIEETPFLFEPPLLAKAA